MAGARTRPERRHADRGAAAVAQLTSTDIEVVLRSLGPPERRQVFQAAGLRLDPARARGRVHELLWSRLRSLPNRSAQYVAMLISARISPTMLAEFEQADPDSAGPDGDPEPDELDQLDDQAYLLAIFQRALPHLADQWSPALLRVALACLEDSAGLPPGSHAALLAAVDTFDRGDGPGHATTLPTATDHPPAPPAAPDVAPVPIQPGPGTDPGVLPPGRLDTTTVPCRVVEQAGGGPLGRLVLDALEQAAAHPGGATGPAALDQLLALAPTEPAAWALRGVATGLGLAPTRDPAAHGPVAQCLADHERAGRLAAHTLAGDQAATAALVAEDPDAAARIVALPVGAAVATPLLTSVVDDHPVLAGSLLRAVPTACDGWQDLIEAVRACGSRHLAGGDAAGAEALLHPADEALTFWAAATGVDPTSASGLHRASDSIAVGRAQCRRARRDFTGALRLLERVTDDLLAPATRAVVQVEQALCHAGMSGPGALRAPGDAGDRARLADRLGRVQAEIAAALDLDPTTPTALLLRGALAACQGDDARVAHDLGAVLARLDDLDLPDPLVAWLRVELAVAELRSLEPGTDEAGYAAIAEVLAGGHQPDPDLLVAAAEALDAHGSPRAAELAAEATHRAPRHQPSAALLADLAGRGVEAAVLAARRAAAGEHGNATRFRLLRAGLAGAGRLGRTELAEALVSELEDVLVRACDDRLDAQWAEALATDEHLRQLLEPALADTVRLHVLRRVGRIEDAQALARSLLHRAAAGSLPGHDPLELVELVAELGGSDEELAALRRLARPGPAAAPDGPDPADPAGPSGPSGPVDPVEPVLVLFVGGDESHARHDAAVERSLAERHGGAVRVTWFHTGWGSGWGDDADRVEACFPDAGAVVLLPLMRTMLGRRLRRTTGEAGLPWLACTGPGRTSIERSITRAAELAAELAAARAASAGTGTG